MKHKNILFKCGMVLMTVMLTCASVLPISVAAEGETHTVTFKMNDEMGFEPGKDKGTLSFTELEVADGGFITSIPEVTFGEDEKEWKAVTDKVYRYVEAEVEEGISKNLIEMTLDEIYSYPITQDEIIYIKSFPDVIGQGENNATNVPDGYDDRLQGIVEFLDYDYSVIEKQVVNYGNKPIAPADPSRGEEFEFTGWYPEIVTQNQPTAQYRATYSPVDGRSTYEITYSLREGDEGSLTLNKAEVIEGDLIGMGNVPTVNLVEGWKFDGFYINGEKKTGLEIAQMTPSNNLEVEVRTYPDIVGQGTDNNVATPDNVDDRLQAVVRFLSKDAEYLLKAEVVLKGQAATAPTTPDVDGFTFIGWDGDFSNVQSDIIVTAQYEEETVNTYKVTYTLRDGDEGTLNISEVEVKHGEAISPENVTSVQLPQGWKLDGYYINGEKKSGLEIGLMTVEDNMTVEVRTYPDVVGQGTGNNTTTPDNIDDRTQVTVSFYDKDGETLISAQVILKGSDAELPEALEHEGFEFSHWLGNYTNVQEDSILIAYYTELGVHYVYVVNEDGETLITHKVYDGNNFNLEDIDLSVVTVPEGWVLDGYYDGENKFDFNTINGHPLERDYSILVKMYPDMVGQGEDNATNVPDGIDDRLQAIVNFYDKDGTTLLKAEVVLKGDDATAPTPMTHEDLIFTGWSADFTNVQENLDIIAQYREKEEYTITYEVRSGDKATLSITTVNIKEGDKIGQDNVTSVSLDTGWKFDGYYIENVKYSGLEIGEMLPSDSMVIEVRTYPDVVGQGPDNNINTPDGIDDRDQAVVKFYDKDGTTLLKAEVVMRGNDATAPQAPVHEGFEFTGWSQDFTNVNDNLTVVAQYKQEGTYLVSYVIRKGDEATLSLSSANIVEGEAIGADNVPTINVSNGWKIDGFYLNGTKMTGLEIMQLVPQGDTTIEVRTYPDMIGQGTGNDTTKPDGVDDRLQAVVKFVDYNNALLKAEVVLKGDDATAPEAPKRDGYTFSKWNKSFNNVQEDLIVMAMYNKNEETKPETKPSDKPVIGCGEHSYWDEEKKMCMCESGYDTPVDGVGCKPVNNVPPMANTNNTNLYIAAGMVAAALVILSSSLALIKNKKRK